MDIPLIVQLANAGIQILMSEIPIFRIHQVKQFGMGTVGCLLDYTLECLYESGHFHHYDRLQG
jgi:hypothetical protein